MGRGRAKAKQTKVARRLKYEAGPTTDLDALRDELGAAAPEDAGADTAEEQDDYADLYSKYDVEEDDEAAN